MWRWSTSSRITEGSDRSPKNPDRRAKCGNACKKHVKSHAGGEEAEVVLANRLKCLDENGPPDTGRHQEEPGPRAGNFAFAGAPGFTQLTIRALRCGRTHGFAQSRFCKKKARGRIRARFGKEPGGSRPILFIRRSHRRICAWSRAHRSSRITGRIRVGRLLLRLTL